MEGTTARIENALRSKWLAAVGLGLFCSIAICGMVWWLGWRPGLSVFSRTTANRGSAESQRRLPIGSSARPAAAHPQAATSIVGGVEVVDRVALFNAARKALDALFRATPTSEQARFLTRPEDAEAFGPRIIATRTTALFTEAIAGTGQYRTGFKVETPESPEGILVVFDHTPDGPKTDGALFIEQQEHRFERFLEAGEGPPGRLYVALQLAHSFEKNAPRTDRFFCLKIQAPVGDGGTVRAYVASNQPEGILLSRHLRWGQVHRAMVELTWSQPEEGAESAAPFLRVTDVTSGDW
jgi:hypothetical protein